MHAFILAGGFATRLWPLTEHRAKPLLPVAGKPMLSWIVEKIPADIPIVVSTNSAFREHFAEWKKTIDRSNLTVRIEETRNDDEKLGTLGATAQWIEMDAIDDDILLLTGDNWLGFDMNNYCAQFDGASALVAAHDIGSLEQATAFGTIIADAHGQVTSFEEKPKHPKSTLVSTGCAILPRSTIPDLLAFAKVKPDNMGGIFEELLRLGKTIKCFRFDDAWFDIGSFETYLEATRAIVGDTLMHEPSSTIHECERIGSVVIGARSRITNSELEDTVVFEDCTIEDCVLRDCVIDNGCILKGIDLTGKMLRAGTTLKRA